MPTKSKSTFGFKKILPLNAPSSPVWWIRLYFFLGSFLGLLVFTVGAMFLLSNLMYNLLFGFQKLGVGAYYAASSNESGSRWEFNDEQKIFIADGASTTTIGLVLIAFHLSILYFMSRKKN